MSTRGHGDMHDLSESVGGVVRRAGVQVGTVHVFNVGSTGAIGTIEFEPGLEEDLPMILDRLIPPSRDYGHERAWHDGNGHSHLQATWLGPSRRRQPYRRVSLGRPTKPLLYLGKVILSFNGRYGNGAC